MSLYYRSKEQLLEQYKEAMDQHTIDARCLFDHANRLYEDPSQALDNIHDALEQNKRYAYAALIKNPARFGNFATDDASVFADFKAAAVRLEKSREQELSTSLQLVRHKTPVPDDERQFTPQPRSRSCEPSP